MKHLFPAAFLLLLAPTPAHAAPPPKPQISFAEVMALCHEAYFGNADKAKAALQSVKSEQERRSIKLLCIAYGAGAQALEDNLVAQREAEDRT